MKTSHGRHQAPKTTRSSSGCPRARRKAWIIFCSLVAARLKGTNLACGCADASPHVLESNQTATTPGCAARASSSALAPKTVPARVAPRLVDVDSSTMNRQNLSFRAQPIQTLKPFALDLIDTVLVLGRDVKAFQGHFSTPSLSESLAERSGATTSALLVCTGPANSWLMASSKSENGLWPKSSPTSWAARTADLK